MSSSSLTGAELFCYRLVVFEAVLFTGLVLAYLILSGYYNNMLL
jgi:hypothetical protein